ncbi:MAG: prohibitin family protein, partial [Patescibacteria group bacterium]|nr:prohibitin family protein [Patescibacteria group bacterium]
MDRIHSETYAARPMTRMIVWAAAGLVLLIILLSSFVTVGPGERGVLMTFGAVHSGVLDPGLHLKLPIAQSVVTMNVQVQKSQADEQASSLDLQDVSTTIATNWNILPADAEWVYQNIGTEDALEAKIIVPAISNVAKAVTAHYNAEELIEKRDVVRAQIEDGVRKALLPYRVV